MSDIQRHSHRSLGAIALVSTSNEQSLDDLEGQEYMEGMESVSSAYETFLDPVDAEEEPELLFDFDEGSLDRITA